jgi:hypothetical protein
MPHVLDFDSKRNGATAFLNSENALGVLMIMDSFTDDHGNFWASSNSGFVFSKWIEGVLPDEDQGALNIATGSTHPTIDDKRTLLTDHACILKIPRTIVHSLYKENSRKPPKGVSIYHITGVIRRCSDESCNCHKLLRTGTEYGEHEVKIFYLGEGDRAVNLQLNKESLLGKNKESLLGEGAIKSKDSLPKDVPVVDGNPKEGNDSIPSGILSGGEFICITSGTFIGWTGVYVKSEKPGQSIVKITPGSGIPVTKVSVFDESITPLKPNWGTEDWKKHPAFMIWDAVRKGIDAGRDRYQMSKDMRPDFCLPFGSEDADMKALEEMIPQWRSFGWSIHTYIGLYAWFKEWKAEGFKPELAPWIKEQDRRSRNNGTTGNRASNVTRSSNYVPPTDSKLQAARLKSIREQMQENSKEND